MAQPSKVSRLFSRLRNLALAAAALFGTSVVALPAEAATQMRPPVAATTPNAAHAAPATTQMPKTGSARIQPRYEIAIPGELIDPANGRSLGRGGISYDHFPINEHGNRVTHPNLAMKFDGILNVGVFRGHAEFDPARLPTIARMYQGTKLLDLDADGKVRGVKPLGPVQAAGPEARGPSVVQPADGASRIMLSQAFAKFHNELARVSSETTWHGHGRDAIGMYFDRDKNCLSFDGEQSGKKWHAEFREGHLHIYGPTKVEIEVIVKRVTQAVISTYALSAPGVVIVNNTIPDSVIVIGDAGAFTRSAPPAVAAAKPAAPAPAAVYRPRAPVSIARLAPPAVRHVAVAAQPSSGLRINLDPCACTAAMEERVERLEAAEAERTGKIYLPPQQKNFHAVRHPDAVFGVPALPQQVSMNSTPPVVAMAEQQRQPVALPAPQQTVWQPLAPFGVGLAFVLPSKPNNMPIDDRASLSQPLLPPDRRVAEVKSKAKLVCDAVDVQGDAQVVVVPPPSRLSAWKQSFGAAMRTVAASVNPFHQAQRIDRSAEPKFNNAQFS